jgi:hypothetical protein
MESAACSKIGASAAPLFERPLNVKLRPPFAVVRLDHILIQGNAVTRSERAS